MNYTIVYEKSPRNYGAWSPDLWGCVTTGKTLDVTRRLMREAIDFHLDGLAESGDIKPRPTGYVEILGFEPTPPRPRKKTRSPVRKTKDARSARQAGKGAPRIAVAHRQFRHPTKPGVLTMTGRPGHDVPGPLWRSIVKRASLSRASAPKPNRRRPARQERKATPNRRGRG